MHSFAEGLVLLAQNGKGGPAAAPSPFSMLFPLLAIGLVFYLLLIRPQRREQKARQAMIANIKKNDRVVTVGGIYGVVANVRPEADEVTLKVDETTNTKLKVTLSAISRVLSEAPSEAKPGD